tara:strand:- start:235 stop:498 length:264 start_codon:yes stop_codon:yes gene_type:complete
MTKKELRELIQDVIQEYMSTVNERGNATDGNNVPSQRIGGEFPTEGEELDFYTNTGAPYGGAEGQQTRGMEKIQGTGNPNRSQVTKY